MRYRVPAKFWDDHSDRCPCDGDPEVAMAREVSRSGSRVLIEGDAQQIECLRSDAAFYCHRWGPDECPPWAQGERGGNVAGVGIMSAIKRGTEHWDGTRALDYTHNDGGRGAAGFKGSARDCVARSVAIASGRPYAEVYAALAEGRGLYLWRIMRTSTTVRSNDTPFSPQKGNP